MLTWEWTTKHATKVREDWAGASGIRSTSGARSWPTSASAPSPTSPASRWKSSSKKKTAELGELLLHHLQARPWLLILDGLERVLVAYHRFDAAQVPDEEAGSPPTRSPTAIPAPPSAPRTMTSCAPSPPPPRRSCSSPPGSFPACCSIRRASPSPASSASSLPGLRPADAEALLRSCGVTGASQAIQNYLKSHCDCHPLVTGVLAGLINDYLPDRGNFDAWAADPAGGGQLNLANLDLVQKRNHILQAALAALPEKSRQLLSTLALLSEAVDYPTLSALNPHLPPEPEEVEEPEQPGGRLAMGKTCPMTRKKQAQQDYQAALQRRKEYEQAVKARLQSPEFRAAPQELARTVRDLEHRGLLQYDAQAKRHDLHPVVRGIAAGGLRQEEKERYGQRVVDHFSQQAHSPYEQAETLEDVRDGLHVVRTLLQMGRYQQAYDAFQGDLSQGATFQFGGLRRDLVSTSSFLSHGWGRLPHDLSATHGSYLTQRAALALRNTDEAKRH